jgi:hypothetical protein
MYESALLRRKGTKDYLREIRVLHSHYLFRDNVSLSSCAEVAAREEDEQSEVTFHTGVRAIGVY